MSAEDEPEVTYELVMPFLPVASKGGPHDDDAYVAGYEMGKLDSTLALIDVDEDAISMTIHASNRGQADLIAMKNGFNATFQDLAPEYSGWVDVLFERSQHA